MTTTLEPALDRPTPTATQTADRLAPGHATPLQPAPAPGPPLIARLALSGHVSRADIRWLAPELDRFVATGAPVVEVDLSAVTRLDAAVARLLLRTSWHLGDPARTVVLTDPSSTVRRVLRWYGAGHLVRPRGGWWRRPRAS